MILLVGASGATGKLLAEQLLIRGHKVKVIVRAPEALPKHIKDHENLTIIHANILDLSDAELVQHTRGCRALASCLGHTLSFKGMFWPPYRLVTDAARRLCNAVKAHNPEQPVRFVLMNTTGNRNRNLNEQISFGQKCIIWLVRLLLPPHADNEAAADYLRTGNDRNIEWVVVRPDSLVDEAEVSAYELHPSPTRSAIFDAGITSRINVSHFMAELITNDKLWHQWTGQMPVIYNTISDQPSS